MANVCAAQAYMVLSLLLLIPYSVAVWFTIPRAGTKCLSEEIQHNVVVLGDFMVINSLGTSDNVDNNPNPSPITISVKVTSPYGNTLHHQQNATFGQFAFTTSEAGNYLACFWVDSQHHNEGPEVNLSLDWRIGIAAKDWESVARKEKIEGVELELRKLEAVVEAIHENLLFLKEKEGEMREVSERTNWRAAWLSILSLALCLAASSLQVWNLKCFFIKKKLI